uniref:protein FAM200C-like n=1 Tax=Myxine glutinosa TaxID=7769 RepID=UPI00358EB4CC
MEPDRVFIGEDLSGPHIIDGDDEHDVTQRLATWDSPMEVEFDQAQRSLGNEAEIAALEENINTAGKGTTGDWLLWTKKAMLTELVRQRAMGTLLQEHFKNKHGRADVEGHDVGSFKIKRARFDSVGTLPKLGFVSVEKPLLLASYKVAYAVAKSKKPHTIAEDLIKPCALEMATTILVKEARFFFEQVPLSNNVIHNRVSDLSEDIWDHVISDIRASPLKISIQLDDSTDVSSCCQLITLVWHVNDGAVKEDFLFCEDLKTSTTAKDVMQLVKDFFAKHDLDIKVIGSVCTDRAPAMLGNKSGFSALMKKEIPDFGQSLNHHIFKSFCEDLGSEHSVLLFHTEVRWLSRGQALTRFFELREEIKVFLEERECDLVGAFESKQFAQMLAYLADIFTRMNDLSVSLQGKGINILKACEKLNAFKEELRLWHQRMERGNLSNFPSLEGMVDDAGSITPTVREEIVAHLEMLSESFDGYFAAGDMKISEEWTMNPYSYNMEKMSYDEELKEDLIDLRTNRALEMQFESKTLEVFWCAALDMFPRLGGKALRVLIPFATTYLCESGFSSLLSIKTKSRNRLNPQADLRIAVSKKVPGFDKIMKEKQEQRSH